MKKTTTKTLWATISAFAISVLKDPKKRAMALSFGKKALTHFKKTAAKTKKITKS